MGVRGQDLSEPVGSGEWYIECLALARASIPLVFPLLPTLRLRFCTEDGGGRFLRNTIPMYQTARRHIPEDRNVYTAWEPQASQRCPRLSQANEATHGEILTECPTTPWSADLLEKLTVVQLVKNFPAHYRIRGFFTEFITAYDLSLPWARWNHSFFPTLFFEDPFE
jgi:hypothetical protein